MKVGAIVLARLDSTRLPGKALRKLGGRPLVNFALECCRQTAGVDEVVLATTDRLSDTPLVEHVRAAGAPVFLGAETDVAGRFLGAMERFAFDAALRFNVDSPFNRPGLLARGVATMRSGEFDIVSNVPGRRFPFGVSVEVVSREAMRRACSAMKLADDREHVTRYFYSTPGMWRLSLIEPEEPDCAGANLAIDTGEDLERSEWILSQLPAGTLWQARLTELVQLARSFAAED
jgi:spore coat polysaccharide biosynthesis protein SpsF